MIPLDVDVDYLTLTIFTPLLLASLLSPQSLH